MKKIIFLISTFISLKAAAQTLKDCSSCSTQIIKAEQIRDMSTDEIRFLINDLFARKGYKFKSEDVDNYYSNIAWYKPVADNEKIVYNSIEKQNIKLFQNRIIQEEEKLISELKNFKATLLSNDRAALMNQYGYNPTNGAYSEQNKYLPETLAKINLDDINWSFGIGTYEVSVNNGNIILDYKIQLDLNGFEIIYGNYSSKKQLYPTDSTAGYDPTDEFESVSWNFEWENNQIKYLKTRAAG